MGRRYVGSDPLRSLRSVYYPESYMADRERKYDELVAAGTHRVDARKKAERYARQRDARKQEAILRAETTEEARMSMG